MSGQLRALKKRIRSVENTKKITRAMEMVASSKLRRYQTLMSKAVPYTRGIEGLLKRVSRPRSAAGQPGHPAAFVHPFFEKRPGSSAALFFMTSDMGLCGSFNTDLFHTVKNFLGRQSEKPAVIAVGKSGLKALGSLGQPVQKSFTDIRPARLEEVLKEIRTAIEEIFLTGKADAVWAIYTRTLSSSTFKPVTEKLLPLEAPDSGPEAGSGPGGADYIYEPPKEQMFQKLVPVCFESQLRMMLLESLVSEQIARMNAMHLATKNAEEMVDRLVLLRNKVRQAQITTELIEIVSGSQALKIQ